MSLPKLLGKKTRNNQMAGISFQEDGIAFAYIQRDDADQVTLRSCEFLPLENGQSVDQILQQLKRKHDLDKKSCVLVMQPSAYTLLHLEAPSVQPEEMQSAVRWMIKDLIEFHVDDAVIDTFNIEKQDNRGDARMMYVVAARSEEIQTQVEHLHAANLKIEAIDIVELSLRNLVAHMPQAEEGNILLAFDRNHGMISLTCGKELYLTRTIPIGTDLLRKLQAQIDSHEGAPGEEVKRMMDRIVLELQRSLDYYDSQIGAAPIRHITFTPLEQAVPDVLNYLNQELPMPVSMMKMADFMDCSDVIPDAVQARCCATVGGALRMQEDEH